MKLRPLSGSPSICCVETRPPVDADFVSTVVASPTTVTSSTIRPTLKSMSTTALRPTVRVMPLRLTVVNPSSEALTLYGPGLQVRRDVAAAGIGDQCARDGRVGVVDDDRRARQHGAGPVFDDAGDRAAGGLRERR